jgi:hypothetical protein
MQVLYATQWDQSLRDSHPPSDVLDTVLATHWKEVGIIEKALQAQV